MKGLVSERGVLKAGLFWGSSPSRWKYEGKSFIKSGLNRWVAFGSNTNLFRYKIKIQFKLHEHSVVSHLDGLPSEFPLCLVGLGEE